MRILYLLYHQCLHPSNNSTPSKIEQDFTGNWIPSESRNNSIWIDQEAFWDFHWLKKSHFSLFLLTPLHSNNRTIGHTIIHNSMQLPESLLLAIDSKFPVESLCLLQSMFLFSQKMRKKHGCKWHKSTVELCKLNSLQTQHNVSCLLFVKLVQGFARSCISHKSHHDLDHQHHLRNHFLLLLYGNFVFRKQAKRDDLCSEFFLLNAANCARLASINAKTKSSLFHGPRSERANKMLVCGDLLCQQQELAISKKLYDN